MTANQILALTALTQHMVRVDCIPVGTATLDDIERVSFSSKKINFTIYCEINQDGCISRLETWDHAYGADPTLHVADTWDDEPIDVYDALNIIFEALETALQEAINRISA